MPPVVIFPAGDVLRGKSPDEFRDALTEKLRGRALEAWIFGSFATGSFDHRRSDVDLILVADSMLPFLERWRDFKDIFSLAEKMDLLVYTPAEWEDLQKEQVGFWGSVHRQRVRLL